VIIVARRVCFQCKQEVVFNWGPDVPDVIEWIVMLATVRASGGLKSGISGMFDVRRVEGVAGWRCNLKLSMVFPSPSIYLVKHRRSSTEGRPHRVR